MTLHCNPFVCDLLNDRCKFFDFFVLEEMRSKGSTDKDLDLIMRLESRSHLLVRHNLSNCIHSSIWILNQELLGALNSEVCGRERE